MGSCMSLGSSSSISSSASSRTIRSSSKSLSNKYENIVRVVHLNGWLEEFEDPVTVGQVTGNQPKHFVFPQAQLLSLDSRPMDSAAQLEVGNIYFLLPHSIFQAEMSPIDLATISKRLTTAAQKPPLKPPVNNNNNDNNNNSSVMMAADATSKVKANRYADRYVPPRLSSIGDSTDSSKHSPRSWKPILESIIERSFTLRSTDSADSSHQLTRP